jgi:hypothetical protein
VKLETPKSGDDLRLTVVFSNPLFSLVTTPESLRMLSDSLLALGNLHHRLQRLASLDLIACLGASSPQSITQSMNPNIMLVTHDAGIA